MVKKILNIALLSGMFIQQSYAELSFSTEASDIKIHSFKESTQSTVSVAEKLEELKKLQNQAEAEQTQKKEQSAKNNTKSVLSKAPQNNQFSKNENKINYNSISPRVMSQNHPQGMTCWDSAGKYHRVDPWLLYSIAYVESRFNPNAIGKNKNGTRDIGMMQINDSVWLPQLKRMGIDKKMLQDPCVSIYVGAWILRQNIDQFGYTTKAIGAYNSRTPKHNVAYAKKVYSAYAKFKKLYATQKK